MDPQGHAAHRSARAVPRSGDPARRIVAPAPLSPAPPQRRPAHGSCLRSPPRQPQPADTRGTALEPDARNLALVLSRLRKHPRARAELRDRLRSVYPDVDDVDLWVESNTVSLMLIERDFSTPASRISDGTMHWLALLGLLLDPDPPPVVCIEEPELGLHPDLIPLLADLLREASARTQILLTTHSESLVSAFTETPEVVVVCERPFGSTVLRRLEREPLSEWLSEYSLGHAWKSGEIGGNRF